MFSETSCMVIFLGIFFLPFTLCIHSWERFWRSTSTAWKIVSAVGKWFQDWDKGCTFLLRLYQWKEDAVYWINIFSYPKINTQCKSSHINRCHLNVMLVVKQRKHEICIDGINASILEPVSWILNQLLVSSSWYDTLFLILPHTCLWLIANHFSLPRPRLSQWDFLVLLLLQKQSVLDKHNVFTVSKKEKHYS